VDQEGIPQYTTRQVLAVWAAAALPMAALAWFAAPWLAHRVAGPAALSRMLMVTLTVGLAWQFLLVLILVRRERGRLSLPVVRASLWVQAPRNPRTGRPSRRLWWMLLPLVVGFAAEEFVPALPAPAARDLGLFLDSEVGRQVLSGRWDWFALIVGLMILNTVLGEELLFRGLLLPRMQRAFGRWDWVVNGLLFSAYHLHMPWAIPGALLDTFTLAWPARRYRSAIVPIVVHSAQTVFFLPFVVAAVAS
jgi:uncharacterized protein